MRRFSVKTLTLEDVRTTMVGLADRMSRDGITPAYVVAILRGGSWPSSFLIERLRHSGHMPGVMQIQIQRRVTGPLRARLITTIRPMPIGVRDKLRIFEARLLGLWAALPLRTRIAPAALDPSLVARFRTTIARDRLSRTTPVAIVDDAIDSGRSMNLAVRSAMAAGIPRAQIVLVVIAHTMPHPAITADYCEYEGVLCRFPWSDDAQKYSNTGASIG